jgi:hypothetical protein
MSMSGYVVAQKKLTDLDRQRVEAFNTLFGMEIEPPEELVNELEKSLGKDAVSSALDLWEFELQGDILEVGLHASGNINYDGGMVIDLDDLPEGTFAIRVYLQ